MGLCNNRKITNICKHRRVFRILLFCMLIFALWYRRHIGSDIITGVKISNFGTVHIIQNDLTNGLILGNTTGAIFTNKSSGNTYHYEDAATYSLTGYGNRLKLPEEGVYDVKVIVRNGDKVISTKTFNNVRLDSSMVKAEGIILLLVCFVCLYILLLICEKYPIRSKISEDEEIRQKLSHLSLSSSEFNKLLSNFYALYNILPIPIQYKSVKDGSYGLYNIKNKSIVIYNIKDDRDKYSCFTLVVLLHELGHYVQYKIESNTIKSTSNFAENMTDIILISLISLSCLILTPYSIYFLFFVSICLTLIIFYAHVWYCNFILRTEEEASEIALNFLTNYFNEPMVSLVAQEYNNCLMTYGVRKNSFKSFAYYCKE